MYKFIILLMVLCSVMPSTCAQIIPTMRLNTVEFKGSTFTPSTYNPTSTSSNNTYSSSYNSNHGNEQQSVVKTGRSWNIEGFYEKTNIPSNALGVNRYGNLEELQYLLVPTDIPPGTYKVIIKYITSKLYEIVNANIYVVIEGTSIFTPCSSYFPTAEVLIKKNYSWELYEIKK